MAEHPLREGSDNRRPVTRPVRIPDALYADLRRWAQIKGMTAGDVMQDAWNEWVAAHKDEILVDLDALRADVEAR